MRKLTTSVSDDVLLDLKNIFSEINYNRENKLSIILQDH